MTHPITEALLAAMAHSAEPMALSDPHAPDHPMMAANDAFCAMTGYARHEVVGRNCRFLQGEGTDMRTAQRIGASIREGHGCIEWIVNHRKNGQAFWNLLFLSPVRDRSGHLLHYFGNQLDITKGLPDWLGEVVFGRAHMTRDTEAEFHRLLLDMLDGWDGDADGGASARLERILASTRRLAELSTTLAPGPAAGAVQVKFLG